MRYPASNAIVVRILLAISIILAFVVAYLYNEMASSRLPYAVGASVVSASQLPPGMVLKHFDVPANEPVPTIGLDIAQDSMGAWEVHVTTTNFTYAPEHINGDPVPGEGHVHLYIDNDLIIMLGPWYRIDSLSPGDHTIRVGLFNNDHSAYFADGQQIQASTTVHVSAATPLQGQSMQMK